MDFFNELFSENTLLLIIKWGPKVYSCVTNGLS